jgi:hypothetical protein
VLQKRHTVGTNRGVGVTKYSHGGHRQRRRCYKNVTRWAPTEASVLQKRHTVGTNRGVGVTKTSHGRHRKRRWCYKNATRDQNWSTTIPPKI